MTTPIEKSTIDVNESPSPIDTHFIGILNTLSQFKTQITTFSTQLKSLEKTVKREIKQHKKAVVKKQNKSSGSRKPSGFAAASHISSELCDFMGKEHGSTIARTEVTKFICGYITQNALRNTDDKRYIKPDIKLKSLLGTDDDSTVTYFNIQRFMNRHFIKNTVEKEKEKEK